MFDLENAITDWKQSLATRESLSPDNIAELETHLRDSVSTLVTGSLNEEEAFLIAQRRVGPAAALGSEYAKLNPTAVWARRLKWMCLGVLVYVCYGRFSMSLVSPIVNEILVPFFEINNSQVRYMLVYSGANTLFFASALVLGVFLTLHHAQRLEQFSSQRLNYLVHVVLSLLVGLIVLPQLITIMWALLFDFSGNVPYFLNVVSLGISLGYPVLLVVAVCFLHRRENASETA